MRKSLLGIALLIVALCRLAGMTAAEPAAPASAPADAGGKIRVLLLSGANNHNWKATTPALKKIYEDSGKFTVEVCDKVPDLKPADFAKYDVLVSNYTTYPKMEGFRWPAETEKAFLEFVKSGHGFVLFHAASTAWLDWPEFGDLIGLTWQKDKTTGKNISGHGAQHCFTVNIVDANHPVTQGMKDFVHYKDELYHRQLKHPAVKILASTMSEKSKNGSGEAEPMIAVVEYGSGRVFHNAMGHDVKQITCPGFATLMLRGTEWAATGKVTIPIPAAEWAEPGSPKAEELKKADAATSKPAPTKKTK